MFKSRKRQNMSGLRVGSYVPARAEIIIKNQRVSFHEQKKNPKPPVNTGVSGLVLLRRFELRTL